MNMTALFSALGAFIIAAGGAVATLWAADGVQNFSDVAQTAYGVAGITGLIAAVNQYRARMAEKPKGKNEL